MKVTQAVTSSSAKSGVAHCGQGCLKPHRRDGWMNRIIRRHHPFINQQLALLSEGKKTVVVRLRTVRQRLGSDLRRPL
jgi:hypothetical protein